ncbi:copper transporter [Microtetraspora sp. AC03309]|uniref:copper transporter n=1 Tax=Microtetraspora sp. AC03309 TaxID=2779376 RepID=UPI001E3E64C9|nr:copper transporter [Microtetraspora sp. AC03309]MCC5575979.1 copper transporter [Microtetraspora sp. AC03309]
MIDFRYHLVSIVAIFLALTVGIVLGSTVLETAFYKSAEETTAQLRQSNAENRDTITALKSREDGNASFVTAHTADLVRGQLPGERFVLIEAPGAPAGRRDDIVKVLGDSGAVYTGRVSLTEKFLAADQTNVVDQLASTVAPAGTRFADGASPYAKAATVLAGAVVTGDRGQAGREDPAAVSVLEAFQTGGFLAMGGSPAQRATIAIVVSPDQAYEGEDAEAQTAAIVSLAAGLDSAGLGTVMVGTTAASGTGGVISALHDAGEAASNVSTVDTVDMPAGRIAVVYALREQLAGRSGAYGVGSDITAFAPPAAPGVSPSPKPMASGG